MFWLLDWPELSFWERLALGGVIAIMVNLPLK
jgi:hypothetical protein